MAERDIEWVSASGEVIACVEVQVRPVVVELIESLANPYRSAD